MREAIGYEGMETFPFDIESVKGKMLDKELRCGSIPSP